jgi:CheY-like chemotaxis protein
MPGFDAVVSLVTMPASVSRDSELNSEPQLVPPPAARPTLLVVDDEQGPRLSLQVIFNDHYHVVLAEDGPSAVEIARHQRIDVAVLDIRMGGMSGIEVLERLRYLDPDIEAVMMTAFETTDTIRQALRLRACDYINKPFDVSTMRTAVANAMERRSLGSELRNNGEVLQHLQDELQQARMDEEIVRTRGSKMVACNRFFVVTRARVCMRADVRSKVRRTEPTWRVGFERTFRRLCGMRRADVWGAVRTNEFAVSP